MSQLPDVPLDGLYGDAIMDHYRNPRRRRPLPDADIESHELNPFCGDEITLQIKLGADGRVEAVSSVSQGCSIIQAAASMMAELMAGQTLLELKDRSRKFRGMMRGEPLSEDDLQGLGDLPALQVVRRYPVRIKCALLPWLALEEGIDQAASRQSRKLTGC
ncbi:MAG TPA: SUF system NifU family Fe-S cluster assembly protein [Dehalococcoidia bacterium]|nr:SUF system NifU family Fe-S cluster assembly protein [Dehalococcoidia bacterium]